MGRLGDRLYLWAASGPIGSRKRRFLRAAMINHGPGFMQFDEISAMCNPSRIPAGDPSAVRVEVLESTVWTVEAFGAEPFAGSDVAGPPCRCGHTRTVHAGPGFWDGKCRVEGCDCTTAGYQPATRWVSA